MRRAISHGRPSVAGHDPFAVSGSNLAPSNPTLRERASVSSSAISAANGARQPTAIPVDLVARVRVGHRPAHQSGRRRDPDRPGRRRARTAALRRSRALVAARVERPVLGVLGQPRVNVLQLNLALDALGSRGRRSAMNATVDDRPDPQALLSAIERERHGALKIFLGAFPGVGKTYKMLEAAREARARGCRYHHRHHREPRTAGNRGAVRGSGVRFRRCRWPIAAPSARELNLDATLKRAPAVVLIDELAHRNIPGTRHLRRYQDIEELLEHGIDVWTTVNIQHLESLNDVVARITGVRMRETVPDTVLSKARDVVLVDLTPRELIERLKQGKVYIPEQARAALDGFFRSDESGGTARTGPADRSRAHRPGCA
ncbi:MAG: potassium-transporting ATPase subunit C [Chromatiales bacterium]|nr:potassium-transporting ATPase subunit C [Chromatiales bacterium]